MFIVPDTSLMEMKAIVQKTYQQKFNAHSVELNFNVENSCKTRERDSIIDDVKVEDVWIELDMKGAELNNAVGKEVDNRLDMPSQDYDNSDLNDDTQKEPEEHDTHFSCNKCTYRTVHNYNYQRHIQTKRCTNNNWNDKCQFCEKAFPSKDAMRIHR